MSLDVNPALYQRLAVGGYLFSPVPAHTYYNNQDDKDQEDPHGHPHGHVDSRVQSRLSFFMT